VFDDPRFKTYPMLRPPFAGSVDHKKPWESVISADHPELIIKAGKVARRIEGPIREEIVIDPTLHHCKGPER
jgi:hypothetical protein